MIPPKCKSCIHRNIKLKFCKAYKYKIEILNTDKCKRHKPKPEEVF